MLPNFPNPSSRGKISWNLDGPIFARIDSQIHANQANSRESFQVSPSGTPFFANRANNMRLSVFFCESSSHLSREPPENSTKPQTTLSETPAQAKVPNMPESSDSVIFGHLHGVIWAVRPEVRQKSRTGGPRAHKARIDSIESKTDIFLVFLGLKSVVDFGAPRPRGPGNPLGTFFGLPPERPE